MGDVGPLVTKGRTATGGNLERQSTDARHRGGPARPAAETGPVITVCHYLPGTSKWNTIEDRMFSFITKNWRGKALTSYQVIGELIAATITETGLRILAEWDQGYYPTGTQISDAEMAALPLTGHDWHPECSYSLTPPELPSRKTKHAR